MSTRRFALLAGLVLTGLMTLSPAAFAAGGEKMCGGPVGKEPYIMNVWTSESGPNQMTVWTRDASKGPFTPMPPQDAKSVPGQIPNPGPNGSKQVLALGPYGGQVSLFLTEDGANYVASTGRSVGKLTCQKTVG